jgi:hypothetical protein
MKHLLLKTLACCALILPVHQAAAQKTFGDLKPGTKFNMVVTKVTATVNTGSGNKPTTVPSGMPNFKVKDKITFTIGAQGELNGKLKSQSLSLPFINSSAALNTYVSNQVGTISKTYTGSLAKSATKKPASLVLDLNRITLDFGGGTFPGIGGSTAHKVVYQLRLAK